MCIGIIEIFLGCYIMFKNKKFFVMVLLFILFSFTACSDEKDVGDIFEKIKEANNLENNNISAGQKIQIPKL